MLTIATTASAIDREISACVELLADEASWARPTRLAGWSVGDLAAHLTFGQQLQADAWRRLAAGDGEPVTATPAAGSPAEVRDELAARAGALQEAFAAAGEDALTNVATMPYGPSPGAFLLPVALMEAGVHRSDLAGALDADDTLADDVAAATFAVLGGYLPVLGGASATGVPAETAIRLEGPSSSLTVRRGTDGWEVDQGPAATTIRGTDSELALFALGRRPLASADLAVDGDPDLAARFKELFPGP